MKRNKKKVITAISVVISVIVILLIAAVLLTDYYSPQKSLERMFSLRAEMKLEEYYDCFDIPESTASPFNSLETYLRIAEADGWTKIDSFEINKKSTNSFSVKYGDEQTELKLIKQKEKAFFIFDTYKIMIESVTEPVLYFVTLKDTEVFIDGNQLDSSLKLNEDEVNEAYANSVDEDETLTKLKRSTPLTYFELYDDSYDNYCFVNVFKHDYEIEITSDYTDPYVDTITPADYPYILRELKLSEQTEIDIKQTAEGFIQKYYYAMQDGEDFESISHLIVNDEEKQEKFRYDYEDLYNLFVRNNTEKASGLVDICFLECNSTVNYPSELDSNQKEYLVYATVMYSYNSVSYDIFEDTLIYNNDMFDETTFRIKCVMQDGKWIVSDVEDTFVNIVY